jgi:hypothetical protein
MQAGEDVIPKWSKVSLCCHPHQAPTAKIDLLGTIPIGIKAVWCHQDLNKQTNTTQSVKKIIPKNKQINKINIQIPDMDRKR